MPPDENNAPSSSAVEIEEVPFEEISLDSLTDQQRENFLLSGKIERPAKTEAPPPSTNKTDPQPSGEGKGTQERKRGTPAGERNAQLDTEIQELEQKLARRAELRRQVEGEPPKGEPKADPPPAAPKPEELKAPVRPQLKDFDGPDAYEQWEEAKLKYAEDVADFRSAQAVQKDREARAEEAKQATQREADKQTADGWNSRMEAAAKKHPDWNEKVTPIADKVGKDPRFAAGAAYILKREAGPEILYYLGEHPDELETIAKLDPLEQPAELRDIERSLTAPKRAREVIELPPPGPKRVTEATPPPTDIRARAQAQRDPIREAIEADDFEAFMREANAADAEAFKRGQR